MAYERTTVYLDRDEAKAAVERAQKSMPDWDVKLSDLIRALIRKFAKGEIKL